ncbi:MAG: ATP-binding cassette domain-containing protein [Flavobacteriales bacterium]|nr:ATP-binding cassette domain-containing protein [Bacteroidota bacterium]MCB9239691.1 ATP-binding cassette domain-containing protein [Flavobacteriales bacterium]
MIDLKDIRKAFDGREVLKGITTSMEPGKTNLIIGASGSGKSVMMKCMVGLLRPDSGSIHYDGRDFLGLQHKELREIRREIGMLFQGSALFDSSTVQENIEFPLKMFTKMTPAERLDRVNFCLEQVHMEGINSKFPAEISGGMKKRVGIARAIAMDIKYLFCDEPNSGLDPVTSRVIDELLMEITQEFQVTTIINTHDMKTVFDIGDKIVFIYEGQKWWEGKKEEVRQSGNPELQAFINASYFG